MNYERKVVCLGGGTGLPALLSGLKSNPWLKVTAVVNMFDTGGSSGELRDRFGILPPGDILKCLLALSNNELYARELLLKRISNHEFPGHTGGNVLLLGLEKVFGSYIEAIDALGQLLSVTGRVAPVTLQQSCLCARYSDSSVHRGETSVDIGVHEGKAVASLFLDPEVVGSPQALAAIQEADVICIGPGSFYTSVLPNLLPRGMKDAVSSSKAKLVYIPNLLREGLGMRRVFLEDAIRTVEGYAGRSVDLVIANDLWPDTNSKIAQEYYTECKYPLMYMQDRPDPRVVFAPLWVGQLARHDSKLLASLLWALIVNSTKAEVVGVPV